MTPASILAKNAELDGLWPLSGRSLAALAAWCDVDLTYIPNAVEGSTLSRSETAIVLKHGDTIGGKPLRDHFAALDHNDALHCARTLAGRAEPLREMGVRELHHLVTLRVAAGEAGQHTRHRRHITGSPVALPSPAATIPPMGDLGGWLATRPHDPETAFAAYERLVTIHPFSDGNGRSARPLMTLMLLKAGYPPVVIGPEDRVCNVELLQLLQLAEHQGPHRAFMAGRLDPSLDHHLATLARGLDQPAPQS